MRRPLTGDGRVVSGSADGTVTVWDLNSGQEERTLSGHGDRVNAVAMTRDGSRHRLIRWHGDGVGPEQRIVSGDRAARQQASIPRRQSRLGWNHAGRGRGERGGLLLPAGVAMWEAVCTDMGSDEEFGNPRETRRFLTLGLKTKCFPKSLVHFLPRPPTRHVRASP
jgi:hypothetical protein